MWLPSHSAGLATSANHTSHAGTLLDGLPRCRYVSACIKAHEVSTMLQPACTKWLTVPDPLQVVAVAQIEAPPKPQQAQTAEFSFSQYMGQQAERVNLALDAAVPLVHPVAVTEAMR